MAVYTPQLSKNGCATLRRMAWAANVPMTKAIDQAIKELAKIMQPNKNVVCSACKERKAVKCSDCYFNN